MEIDESTDAEMQGNADPMNTSELRPEPVPLPPGRIVFGANFTIREVQSIKADMIEQLSRPAPYELDGTAVERIDAAGVQVLVAFALDCLERNLGFVWTGRSACLEYAISVLGVAQLLESPGVAPITSAG